MKIEVMATPQDVSEPYLRGKIVIVIDVLRASTTIMTALEHGATQVIPAIDVEEATMIAGRIGRGNYLLGGERHALKMPDYDFGNSPVEYTRRAVEDKTLIFTTTNGTAAILAARGAYRLLIGCMRNRTAVAKLALAEERDIVLLCAGTEGSFSADDICCAGAIVEAINAGLNAPAQYNDLALVSSLIYAGWKDGSADLAKTKHYHYLQSLQLQDDLTYCFEMDKSDTVPEYKNGTLVL
ncbi:MAG: 2-phosphosulfolactate phosphatase [Eubacteriales bacterium]|nr:2-phosphosulfolactate phosphatase [Eubacteriales bacterium]